MIIQWYLIREIAKPLAAIFGILVALFASYGAAGILADAVNGLMSLRILAALVGLKVLISLDVLIPVSLFLSVVLCFSRLHGDSEFTAMYALGVTPARVAAAVFALSGGLALIVFGLSMVVRPWAYQMTHTLSRRAAMTVDVNAIEAGTFYIAQNGDRVIFVGGRDGAGGPARDVFVQIRNSDDTEIIYAPLATRLPRAQRTDPPQVFLSDAHIYDFGRTANAPDQLLDARGLIVDPDNPPAAAPSYSSVATSSARLAASGTASDAAELQWRLSTPVSTLLLGMLGIPLSRARPRQGRFARFGAAILIYAGYYLLITSARTWVQHGALPARPGIWWAPALLAAVLLVAAFGPGLRPRFIRRHS